MPRLKILLFFIPFSCLSPAAAQAQLTENDSLRLAGLADEIYSIQVSVTGLGLFKANDPTGEISSYTFNLNGTGCRLDTLILTTTSLADEKSILREFFRSVDQDPGLSVYSLDTIIIRQAILSYWGASYTLTHTLVCEWTKSEIGIDEISNLINQVRTARIDLAEKSFQIINADEKLGLALLATIPPLKPGKISLGEGSDVDDEDLLVGLNAEPRTIPRMFNFNIYPGRLLDDNYELIGLNDWSPAWLLLLKMLTSSGNAGDPIISVKDQKMVGITATPPNYEPTERLVIPAEEINEFYQRVIPDE